MALFGKKKKEDDEEAVLLSDEEYDAESELQKQMVQEEAYQERMLAEEAKTAEKEEAGITVEDLLLKTEKIEGKLASFEEARGRIDDRILRVSEQVGELRSMLLEREKSFGILESEFEMIKDVFEDVKPSEFLKELDKKETEIAKTNANVEKLETMVQRFSEEVMEFRDLLGKIKSFENLVDIAREVSEKVTGINETKQYTERLAAKSESIFAELNKQLATIEDYKSQIMQNTELTAETVRSLDDLAVKLGTSATEESLKSSLMDLEDALTKKFGASEKLAERLESFASSVEFMEKRVRIMELDKVSTEVGEKIKELSPGLTQMRRIEQLTRERKDILDLMQSTEKEHGETVSDEAYEEIKKSSEKKLKEIKGIIKGDLQTLEAVLEKELGPLISRETRVISEEVAEAPEARVEEPAAARGPEKVPEASIEDRIGEEMKKMKTTGEVAEPELEPELESVAAEVEEGTEVEAEPGAAPVEAAQEPVSPEGLEKIDEKIKLMETEEGTIQNLLNGLEGSSMESKKRALLEKKYNDRLKKISGDIAELRQQRDSAMGVAV